MKLLDRIMNHADEGLRLKNEGVITAHYSSSHSGEIDVHCSNEFFDSIRPDTNKVDNFRENPIIAECTKVETDYFSPDYDVVYFTLNVTRGDVLIPVKVFKLVPVGGEY